MYSLQYHKTITPERWRKYLAGQQLLMIGNELNRLINCIKHGFDESEYIIGMEKTIELVDLTVESQAGNLRKELLRWRELFVENYIYEGSLATRLPILESLYKVLLLLDSKSALVL